jgi:hypothetical protein
MRWSVWTASSPKTGLKWVWRGLVELSTMSHGSTLFPILVKRLDPQFQAKVYGYKDLPTLVQSCPDLFLTRKQTAGKTKHIEVWLVTGK